MEPLFNKIQDVQQRALPVIPKDPEPVLLEAGPPERNPSDSLQNEDAPPWSVLTELVTYAPSPKSGISISALPPQFINASITPVQITDIPPPDPNLTQPFGNVFAEIKDQKTFDESTDISITYMGETTLDDADYIPKLSFNFDFRCHIKGHLSTGAAIDILIDTGATKSYLSRKYYEEHPYLHELPKYKPHLGPVRMGDGTMCAVDFIIPIIVTIQGHVFEIYSLITTMGNTELVIGVKELMELEATITTQNFKVEFMNRSPSLYPRKPYSIPVGKTQDIDAGHCHAFIPRNCVVQVLPSFYSFQAKPLTRRRF